MRQSRYERTTRETTVSAAVHLDNAEPLSFETNLPLFSHFLQAMGKHGHIGWQVQAHGDIEVDPHHLIEDVGIAMGHAVLDALGDKAGIARYGQRYLPMDDALVLCAVDISGRGRLFWSGPFPDRNINGINAEVWPEFFGAFAAHSGMTVHMHCQAGTNAHHIYEAAFKSLGQALYEAVQIHAQWGIPSTKGVL